MSYIISRVFDHNGRCVMQTSCNLEEPSEELHRVREENLELRGNLSCIRDWADEALDTDTSKDEIHALLDQIVQQARDRGNDGIADNPKAQHPMQRKKTSQRH